MKVKKIIIISLILCILLSINSVNAIESDLNQTDIYSESIPDDSLNPLRDIIENSNENDTIYVDNSQLNAPNNFEPININKTITIIGENTLINGNGNGNLFITNQKITIKNFKFTNTVSFTIINNGNVTLENCICTDLWENAIHNTGNLEIINSTFENIKSIYTNENINSLSRYYQNSGVIYNTGTLTIHNSKFNNITNPNQITFNNKTIVIKEGIIYNLNNLTIANTNFTNITGRIINNTGKLNVENANIRNISTYGICIEINTTTRNYNITYNKHLEGLIIHNTNELILKNTSIKDLYYDAFWSRILTLQTKNGPIYTSGNCTIENSFFENIGDNYEELKTDHKQILNGGAISNYGLLNIKNTSIIKTESEYGGAIYNAGNATIDKITSCLSTALYKGYSIYNKNEITIKNSIFYENNDDKDYGNNDCGVIHNTEEGKCDLVNSTIKNNKIEFVSNWPFIYYGVVQNMGKMNITRCIFDNNTPASKYYFVTGSYGIYNNGDLIATHNIFLNMDYEKAWHPDAQLPFVYAFNDAGKIYMTLNYFECNSDPFEKYTNFEIHQFFILDLEPEYSALKIGEKTNITATLKLDNGKYYTNYELLPDMYLTFNVNGQKIIKKLVNGKATVEFNQSEVKGSYNVSVQLGKCIKVVDIDVGKNYTQMDVKAEDIYYGDDATFYMNVTGNLTRQPTGKISVIIDGKVHTTDINDGKASLTISGLKPKTYNVKVRY